MALSLEEVAKRISKNLLSTVVALGGYNIHQAGFPLKLNGFHVPDVIGKKRRDFVSSRVQSPIIP